MLKVAAVIAFSLLLVACGGQSDGDVQEGRQFANEPVTRSAATPSESALPTSPVDVDATPVIREPVAGASPDTLLRSRGTPNTLYTLVGTHLVALQLSDGTAVAKPVSVPDDQQLLDFDGSPSGNQVATLTTNDRQETLLTFFSDEGEPLGTSQSVLVGGPSATPASEEINQQYEVSWSPQGNDVLITDGVALESVRPGGEPEALSLDGLEGQLLDAEWSPQGSLLFFHLLTDDGSQHVFVRDVQKQKTRELRPLSTGWDEGLVRVQWLPDGSGVSYVRGSLARGVVMGGQLYAYTLGQESPDLLATSGRGGPSATITDAAVSPDGQSVVYVISLLEGSEWAFHSMWVRALDGMRSYQVPAVPRGVVTRVTWADGGLAWEQRRQKDAPAQVLVAQSDQKPAVIFNEATTPLFATPKSTPGASPGATPIGSPGASPIATPVGSPGATPES